MQLGQISGLLSETLRSSSSPRAEKFGIVLNHRSISCLLCTLLDQVLYSSLTMLENTQENVNGYLDLFFSFCR